MDARERLRSYLEQRREMGESEFVLDGMSVADALSTIDKLRSSKPAQSSRPSVVKPPPATAVPAEGAPIGVSEPRTMSAHPRPVTTPKLDVDAAAQVDARVASQPVTRPAEPVAEPVAAPAVAPVTADQLAAKFSQGLVVGSATGTLFEQNPFHDVASMADIAKLIEDCTRCDLYKTARCAVPGDGDPDADFMCVGEAPGANEDETGHPFVGQAGGLLTKILAAIDLTREQVFITNVLKHRPPANRNPQPDEIEACSPYLVRQIQMVQPKVILALGTFAAQTLLATKTPIGKLRGAIHRYYGIPLVVTYHPAALLRNPAWKRPTWEDVKLARLVLDSSKS